MANGMRRATLCMHVCANTLRTVGVEIRLSGLKGHVVST